MNARDPFWGAANEPSSIYIYETCTVMSKLPGESFRALQRAKLRLSSALSNASKLGVCRRRWRFATPSCSFAIGLYSLCRYCAGPVACAHILPGASKKRGHSTKSASIKADATNKEGTRTQRFLEVHMTNRNAIQDLKPRKIAFKQVLLLDCHLEGSGTSTCTWGTLLNTPPLVIWGIPPQTWASPDMAASD